MIELQPEPATDGVGLLDELHATLKRFVVFPDKPTWRCSGCASLSATDPLHEKSASDQPKRCDCSGVAAVAAESANEMVSIAVTLWIAATHAQDAWQHATRLVIKSPLKRCGKSRLLDLIAELAHNVLLTVNISTAALVRVISETDPPTILIDEADTIFGTRRGQRSEASEDLRGILNAGHGRGRPYIRWDINTRKPEEHPTFAMAALAGIGDMPDTIEDRAIVVVMRRRAPGERVTPLRISRDVPGLRSLRDRIGLYIGLRANSSKLTSMEPVLPVEDRAADTWEPLIAVADLAGGHWPALARAACTTLVNHAANSESSISERLLADLKAVFDGEQALWTSTIIDKLAEIDEAPWAEYREKRKDPRINGREIAKLLGPYGIHSRDIRAGGQVRKGYDRDGLQDAWERYLAAAEPAPTPTSATAATALQPPDPWGIDAGQSGYSRVADDVADSVALPLQTDETPIWRCDRCDAPTTHRLVAAYSHTGCGGQFKAEP